MKSKTLFSWLVNPFTHIAGAKALYIGLCIQLVTVFFCNTSGVHFNSVMGAHIGETVTLVPVDSDTMRVQVGEEVTLLQDLFIWGISIGLLIMMLYISGLILTKGFRIIDLIGTVLMARAPLLIIAIIALFIEIPSVETIMADSSATSLGLSLYIFAALLFIIFIWSIVLLYNAYRVSVGLSVNKAIISFIVAIVIAQIGSQQLIACLV